MLKNEVISLCMRDGANLVGFASIDRFDGAPQGHHPRDFISSARAVISIGMIVPRAVLNYQNMLVDSEFVPESIRKEYLQKYFYRSSGYDIINNCLNTLGYRLTQYLERMGFLAVYFTATYGDVYFKYQQQVPGQKGIFSHRHAAVRAGLGEFGLNNIVVTPKYGPRVRFNSIITDAPLKADELLQKKVCLGMNCQKCIDQCGTEALRFKENIDISGIDDKKVCLDPITSTDVPTCKVKRTEAFCTGHCLRVCPIGE